MKLPSKTMERRLFEEYDYVIGVDEVGMGCLAGPVVVCAVAFGEEFFRRRYPELSWLRDSKLLNAKQREEFAKELMELKGKTFIYTLTTSHVVTIDKINIYQAARRAMRRAVRRLNLESRSMNQGKSGSHNSKFMIHDSKSVVLVDGPYKIKDLPDTISQIPVVKGDRKVFSIACASIMAKVYRDRMMINYAKKFPGYGFEKHKGYGTKLHLERLVSLGPCAVHRRGFAPVARLL